MTVLVERYVTALRAVNEIMNHRDVMCRSPDMIPVSIDDLKWVVGEFAEVEIEQHEVSFDSAHVSGAFQLYQNQTAKIYVRSGLSNNEKRVVAVKELAHLIIDGDDARSARGVETIRSLVAPAFPPNGEMGPIRMSERLAMLIAVELLYPHEYRREDQRQIMEGTQTEASLAMHYEIPSYIVGQTLDSEWLNAMDRCWQMVRA